MPLFLLNSLRIIIITTFFCQTGNAVQTLKVKDSVKVMTVRGTSFDPSSLEGSADIEKGTIMIIYFYEFKYSFQIV